MWAAPTCSHARRSRRQEIARRHAAARECRWRDRHPRGLHARRCGGRTRRGGDGEARRHPREESVAEGDGRHARGEVSGHGRSRVFAGAAHRRGGRAVAQARAARPGGGGYFRRTAESETILPDGRRAWSVIYSLFTPEGFSALHRLKNDEIWCFHAGDPLESLRLKPDGGGEWVKLGLDLAAGESPQSIVPANVWQGTRLVWTAGAGRSSPASSCRNLSGWISN